MIQKKIYRLNFASYLVSFLPELIFLIMFTYLLVSVLGASKSSYLNISIAILVSFFIFILKLFFIRFHLDENSIKIKGMGEKTFEIKWKDMSEVKAKQVNGILRLFKSSYLEIYTNEHKDYKIKDLDCYNDYQGLLSQLRIRLGDKFEITK